MWKGLAELVVVGRWDIVHAVPVGVRRVHRSSLLLHDSPSKLELKKIYEENNMVGGLDVCQVARCFYVWLPAARNSLTPDFAPPSGLWRPG